MKMASVFGHVVSAIGIGSVFPAKKMTPKVFLIGAVSAALPDIDVMSDYFTCLHPTVELNRKSNNHVFTRGR